MHGRSRGGPQTIRQLLQLARSKKINLLDAELIIAHVLHKPREFVIAHPEKTIDKIHIIKYKQMMAKRAKNTPLAYLTGHKEFFGLNFLVNKNVLIPRPETELIVEKVIEKLQNANCRMQNTILIDVGTGSGCIPISILTHLHTYKLTHLQTFATDIFCPALVVARRNAKHHGVKIKFFHGNLLEPISNFKFQISDSIIITANLPYLTNKQYKEETSIKQEPKNALVAGPDGLKFYCHLLRQIHKLFCNQKSAIYIFLEIDPSQTSSIKLLIKKYLPKAKIIIHQDLAKKNRIVEIKN